MAFHHSKLSREEVEKIFFQLCSAIASTKNTEEAVELIRDLLSYQEAEMIAKRLKIAELLWKGETYESIGKNIKVCNSTIAKVQEWMKISGEGYRRAIKGQMITKENSGNKTSSYLNLKRKYPMYYWPQLLIEELITNSGKRQKEKIKKLMHKMERSKEKSELFHRINQLLR